MDYQYLEVTKQSSDGRVAVIGEIELCITSAMEFVQAKRHRKTVQRKLDTIRGLLHRFRAVHGIIITTSRFAAETEVAAAEPGVEPQ